MGPISRKTHLIPYQVCGSKGSKDKLLLQPRIPRKRYCRRFFTEHSFMASCGEGKDGSIRENEVESSLKPDRNIWKEVSNELTAQIVVRLHST